MAYKKSKMNALDWTVMVLLLIGGLNWGLVGAFQFNLVEMLFGTWAWLVRVVYGLVGLSALYGIYTLVKVGRR